MRRTSPVYSRSIHLLTFLLRGNVCFQKAFLLFCVVLIPWLNAAGQGFYVADCQVDIVLDQQGWFDVTEKYEVHFDEPKHGIFRDILTRYELVGADGRSEVRNIDISRIEVPGENYEISRTRFGNAPKVSIKIGDADKTISGKHHYEIRYRVKHAYLYEDSLVQFYWDVKPEDWQAPFLKVAFTVHLPEGLAIDSSQCFVYSGWSGNTAISEEFQTHYSNGVFSGQSREKFSSYRGQSVTVLLKLPPGSIAGTQPFFPFWRAYGWVLILGGLVFGFFGIWLKYGKDDHAVTTTAYYPPRDLDPAMSGFLIDDRNDSGDLISLIPFWAANGLLKIQEIPKDGWFSKADMRLTRLRPLPAGAPDYQRVIFDGLFRSDSILVSSLRNSFYQKMSRARSKLKVKGQLYYNPQADKIKRLVSIILVVFMFGLFGLFAYVWGLVAAISALVTCILLLYFSRHLVRKNAEGTMVLSELKGFKRFIEVAEEAKLKMLLEEDPGYFETTMSYALAFGLFDKWADKFDALNQQPPSWYESPVSGGFNSMGSFSQSFSSSISSAQSTMVSSPSSSSSSSSSGGGSSGGGFGGGGGGSW